MAVTFALDGEVPQVASPWLVMPGLMFAGGPHTPDVARSDVLTHQFTGRGVTVVGGALNVPVATYCTWPFAVWGLTEID